MSLEIFAVGFIQLVLGFVLMASMPAMAQTSTPAVALLGFAVGKATLNDGDLHDPGLEKQIVRSRRQEAAQKQKREAGQF